MPNVFCLVGKDGQLLNPSVQATILAKYSRSSLSAKEILSSISAEESDKFNDKWIVGYGHSSIMELATVPICMEGISIVASKFIETIQRGAFSEKSTRYQVFSGDSFITPPGGPATMHAFAKKLYSTYDKLKHPMLSRCATLLGLDPNNPKVLRSTAVKTRAFDSLRYLLPAGTGTNVACVLNFRDARDLVSLLLGHSNSELRSIGVKTRDEISSFYPVLIRHANPNTFEPRVISLGATHHKFNQDSPNWYAAVVDEPNICQRHIIQENFKKVVETRYGMDWESFSSHMKARPEHSEVPDVFKTVPITFDTLMDYGAFRDLQRHRRCEQYVEPLTTQYGYVVPDDVVGSSIEPEFVSAMESVTSYSDDVANDADMSQYNIPLGYLHRSVFQMTLKELYYIIEQRSQMHGHISYRRVVCEWLELAKRQYPDLMAWCRIVPVSTCAI